MLNYYPNQVATYTVRTLGPGGVAEAAALSGATLTVAGQVLAATIVGQTVAATIPAGAAPGAASRVWAWTQTAGGVTTAQTITVAATILAAPAMPGQGADAPYSLPIFAGGYGDDATIFVGGYAE